MESISKSEVKLRDITEEDLPIIAIISQSPGNLSAFGANHHLWQPLVFLNMPTLQQPEAYIGNVANLLDENSKIKEEGTVKFLQSFVYAKSGLLLM